jgi:prepilin-type N-terminal cleavage/methylation domain-containing protein
MLKNTEKNIIKKSKGFTLIELVVSLFILAVAIIGVYNSFSTIVVLTTDASSRLTASYLAQEGIEIIRNIRDNNWIQNKGWTAGLLDCEYGCEADHKTGTSSEIIPLRDYPTGGNRLKIGSDNFYNYDSTAGIETKFKRKITITPQGNNILKVSVLVIWQEKEEEGCDYGYCIEAEEYLYDWY